MINRGYSPHLLTKPPERQDRRRFQPGRLAHHKAHVEAHARYHRLSGRGRRRRHDVACLCSWQRRQRPPLTARAVGGGRHARCRFRLHVVPEGDGGLPTRRRVPLREENTNQKQKEFRSFRSQIYVQRTIFNFSATCSRKSQHFKN